MGRRLGKSILSIIRQILKGIGLRKKADIEYRERSPLVIPQGRNLPAPEATTGVKDPNWPVKPAVKRARQAKAAERATGGRLTGDPFLDDGKSLTQTEMTPGRGSSPTPVKPGANDAALIKDGMAVRFRLMRSARNSSSESCSRAPRKKWLLSPVSRRAPL